MSRRGTSLQAALVVALSLALATGASAQTSANSTCQISDAQLASVVFHANLPCGGTPLNCSACLCALARPLVPLFTAGGVVSSDTDIENIFSGCQAAIAEKLITSGAISAAGLVQVAACDTNVLLAESDTCFAGLLPSDTTKNSSSTTNVTAANGPSEGNVTSPNATSPRPGNVTSPRASPSQGSPVARLPPPLVVSVASPPADRSNSSPLSYTISACVNGLLLAVAVACMMFI